MNVGDKVRVVRVPDYLDDDVKACVGKEGVIVEMLESNMPRDAWVVALPGDEDGYHHFFYPDELELVEEAPQ